MFFRVFFFVVEETKFVMSVGGRTAYFFREKHRPSLTGMELERKTFSPI